MGKTKIFYVDSITLERIYMAKVCGYRINLEEENEEEIEIPPSKQEDFESKIQSGFKIFEMSEKGYPQD